MPSSSSTAKPNHKDQDCLTLPTSLCISPSPNDAILSCGCALVNNCSGDTWDGRLAADGRCSYGWYPIDQIDPCLNGQYVWPSLRRFGNVWILKWECYDVDFAPVILWQGLLATTSPVGTYLRVTGCDATASYAVATCALPSSSNFCAFASLANSSSSSGGSSSSSGVSSSSSSGVTLPNPQSGYTLICSNICQAALQNIGGQDCHGEGTFFLTANNPYIARETSAAMGQQFDDRPNFTWQLTPQFTIVGGVGVIQHWWLNLLNCKIWCHGGQVPNICPPPEPGQTLCPPTVFDPNATTMYPLLFANSSADPVGTYTLHSPASCSGVVPYTPECFSIVSVTIS